MGTWQLRTFLAFAALCAAGAGVCAQPEEPLEGLDEPVLLEAEPTLPVEAAPPSEPFEPLPSEVRGEEQATPAEEPAPIASAEPAPVEAAPVEPGIVSEAPLADAVPPGADAVPPGADAVPPGADAVPPGADAVPPAADVALSEAPGGIGNADVQAMVEAEFADSTIFAVINANDVQFDLSPRALVALKGAGVSEPIIEAMIAAEEAKESPAEPEPASAEVAQTQASVEYARLTAMVEQLAAKQEAAQKAQRAPEPPATRADPTPRVWLIQQEDRAPIAPTIAQVAFAGGSRRGERMKNLQGLANQALAFASPAVSGIATTLGGLFRPDEDHTAVWALSASQSSRVLDVAPVFEIDFAHIPGVDPDRYQPAIVQLVPTNDNYRLVAAAETEDASKVAPPRGPIIEESIATESTRLGRGQYRVAPRTSLGPGEYALVLRPISETRRERRRNSEASLGDLLGGNTSQILYLTWDFSIPGEAVAHAR